MEAGLPVLSLFATLPRAGGEVGAATSNRTSDGDLDKITKNRTALRP